MAKILYQGHGSLRLTTSGGAVIYIDPYAGEGYDEPADLVLVTHQHHDHNKTELITLKEGGKIICEEDAIQSGKHVTFFEKGVKILPVLAHNINHHAQKGVGYVLEADGVKMYFAGDTSGTNDMKTLLPELRIDYAFLPIDGVYNMGPGEASACAELIGAKHNVPIHMKPGALFDRSCAESFSAQGRMIVEAGQEIEL